MSDERDELNLTELSKELLMQYGTAIKGMEPGTKDTNEAMKIYLDGFTKVSSAEAEAAKINNDAITAENKEQNEKEFNQAKLDLEKMKVENDKSFNENKLKIEERKVGNDKDFNDARIEQERIKQAAEELLEKKARRGATAKFIFEKIFAIVGFGGYVALHVYDWHNNQKDILTNPESKDHNRFVKNMFTDFFRKNKR